MVRRYDAASYYPDSLRNGNGATLATRSENGVGGDDPSLTRPLFSSSFPTPPRRQVPALHDVPFEEDGGATYRHADSTTRALAQLAKQKYERQERRRAALLLGALAFVGLAVHGVSGGVLSRAVTALTGAAVDPDGSGLGGAGADDAAAGGVRAKRKKKGGGGGHDGEPRAAALTEEQLKEQEVLSHFSRLADVASTRKDHEKPLFWHVPRAAGSTMKDIMGQCLNLVSACEVGVRDGHGQDPEIQVINVKGIKYVNVDTTSLEGIERAKNLGLAPSGMADVVVSSYLQQAATLYTPDAPGRAFTLLRDPVERAVSMYYYRSSAYGDLQGVTLEQYAQGNGIENNWMTRYLVNQMEGELDNTALDHAKLVLERKFLVGFLDDFEESVYRFMKYNGWRLSENDTDQLNQAECMKTLTQVGVNKNAKKYEIPKRGTQAFALITWQTQTDMKLYEYAKELFDKQTKIWGSKERKKADKKKKKAAEGK